MVTGFSCHADAAEAARRGADGFRFFQFALGHHYSFGTHTPGRTNIWNKYVAVRDALGTEMLGGGAGCIGAPDDLQVDAPDVPGRGRRPDHLHPAGRQEPARAHLRIARAVRRRGDAGVPRTPRPSGTRGRWRSSPRTSRRRSRARSRLKALADDEIPSYPAYGLTVAEPDPATLPEANRRRRDVMKRMREIMEKTR